jgi:hypothetical protein
MDRESKHRGGGGRLEAMIENKGKKLKSLSLRSFLSLMRSSSRKLQIISFHNWANLAASLLLFAGIYTNIETCININSCI